MNKKSIGALLLSFALLVGASGGTYAYFTADAHTDKQVITLGKLAVAFKPTNGNHNWCVVKRAVPNYEEAWKTDPRSLIDLSIDGYDDLVYSQDSNTIEHVAPGDVLCKCFTLKNEGTLDAKVKLSLENMKVLKADGTVVDETAKSWIFNNNLFKAYKLDANGNPTKDEITLKVDADHPGNFILDATPQESIIVYAMVYLDKSINNDAMENSVNFDVKADATQWNNPGWNQ